MTRDLRVGPARVARGPPPRRRPAPDDPRRRRLVDGAGARSRPTRATRSPSTAATRARTRAGCGSPTGRTAGRRASTPAAFAWTDQAWRGRPLDGAVVYEAHVGTFTPEGTLDSAVERLPHLVDLGVDVVELLPLAPFPGERNWGYDGIAPCAVHEAYGGPAALQRFVDAAHAHGLAVCLDVVYNHLGPDGNYLAEFGPYLTDRYVTPWGQALNLDGPDSDPVRAWVLDNVEQWLRDFHVDGLRLDAVHELHDDRATAPAGGDGRPRRRARRRARPGAVAGRRVRPQRPAHGHPAGPRRRDRRARPARAVGRRRPPRAARRADRRDPGLLRRLRRPRRPGEGAAHAVLPRRDALDVPRPRARPAGRPRAAAAGTSSPRCRPTTRSATVPSATGSRCRCRRGCSPAVRRSC